MKTILKFKVISLIVAALILVGGGIAVGVAVNNNTPENVAKNAVLGVFQDFLERDEINPIYNMVQGGSVQISLNEMVYVDGEERSTVSTPVSGKMYFSEKAIMLEDIDAEIEGFKIKGDVYVSDELIYLSEEEYLDIACGIELDDFVEDLEDSILNPDSGSKYSIDEDTFDKMIEAIESAEDINSKELKKDLEKVVKKYINKLWNAVCKHAEFESETDKIKLNGERENVRVVTITIDNETIAGIIETMYEFIQDDKSVSKLLEEYEDILTPYLEELTGTDIDDIVEFYEDTIEDLENEVESIIESVEDGEEIELVVSIATPEFSSTLLKLEAELETNGYDSKLITLDFGPKGLKKTNMITVEMGGVELVYEIATNNSKKYEASLEVYGEEVLSLAIDKSEDTFNVRMGADDYGYREINGSLVEKRSTITIGVEEIKTCYESYALNPETGSYDIIVENETSVYTDLEVVIKEKDKIPSAPKDYDTIADIKESDIDAIFAELNMLNGKYENEGVFGVGATTVTFEGNTIKIETLELEAEGTYKIDGDEIKIEIEDENEDETSWGDLLEAWEGTFEFEKGVNYIKIDGTKYTKAD